MKLNVQNPINEELTQKDAANSRKKVLQHDVNSYYLLVL